MQVEVKLFPEYKSLMCTHNLHVHWEYNAIIACVKPEFVMSSQLPATAGTWQLQQDTLS